jgi:hypothetical protein
VLEALHHLTRLAGTDPRQVFEGAAGVGVIASRGAEGTLELALSGTFRRKKGELSVSFASIEDYPFTDTYKLESRWGERRSTLRRELNPPEEQPAPAASDLPLGLVVREAAYLDFDLDRLAEPSYSDLPTPVMGPDGSGLAAVVADMAVARPDDFGRLQEALRAVIPGLARVRLVRAKVARSRDAGEDDERVWGHEIVFDMAGATDIPARAASEGMLRALGLFTTLMGPDRHELVLIDHLERGINARSYAELVAQLSAVLALDPRLQIVAVTDAPALVDHVSAESVRVHCLLEDGSVRIKPLVDHPDYEMLRSDLRPGEFWTQVGEDWVAATQPPPLPQQDPGPTILYSAPARPGMPPLPTAAEASLADDAPPDTPRPPGTRRWPPSMPPLPPGMRGT